MRRETLLDDLETNRIHNYSILGMEACRLDDAQIVQFTDIYVYSKVTEFPCSFAIYLSTLLCSSCNAAY